MKYQLSSLSLFSVIIIAYVANVVRKFLVTELNLPDYLVSEFSHLFVTDLYPKRGDIADAEKWRKFVNMDGNFEKITSHGNMTDVEIKKSTGRNAEFVRVRVYVPSIDTDQHDTLPVVLWAGGGGFTVHSIDHDNPFMKTIAHMTNAIVVAVDYSQAPEKPYPAGVEDMVYVLDWISKKITTFGGNPKKIVLTGQSAGATMVAAATAVNYDKSSNYPGLSKSLPQLNLHLAGMVLVYPPLDATSLFDSHFEYRKLHGMLTLDQMLYFWSLWLGSDLGAHCQHYTACPLKTPDHILKRMPRTAVILAKYDVLRDEGLAYAHKLAALDVPVQTKVWDGSVHGFFGTTAIPSGKESMEYMTAQIRNMVA
jgi:acetyl esterase